jgi:cytosine/adenosine deaminase-related metal-dependent hydrolase
MILRARLVIPFAGPPVENARIVIRRGRIESIGVWGSRALSRRGVTDLGEVLVLPGLVNAHCHLDYTDMAGYFAPPKVFTEWLQLITETKAGWEIADFATSWRHGAEMLARSGTTTVGDIEAFPELLPKAWESTPMRVISFLEMIGITNRRQPDEILNETLGRIGRLPHRHSRAALSPHAPYSTSPALLELAARTSRRHRLPVSIHVAESRLEFDMFTRREGEMFEWLMRSKRDMSDCGAGSPLRHLARSRLLGRNVLAVHLNYLLESDMELLTRSGTQVVHCPRSHYYFRHDAFPLSRLVDAGVNVCLGTDSLASVCRTRGQALDLNMFEEMRSLQRAIPQLRPETIFRMATVNGAKALGLAGRAGELSQGAFADLIAIPWKGSARNALAKALDFSGELSHRMIGGRWLASDGPKIGARMASAAVAQKGIVARARVAAKRRI